MLAIKTAVYRDGCQLLNIYDENAVALTLRKADGIISFIRC